jgi:hypothetical protein
MYNSTNQEFMFSCIFLFLGNFWNLVGPGIFATSYFIKEKDYGTKMEVGRHLEA